jgi:hypothetical protein
MEILVLTYILFPILDYAKCGSLKKAPISKKYYFYEFHKI